MKKTERTIREFIAETACWALIIGIILSLVISIIYDRTQIEAVHYFGIVVFIGTAITSGIGLFLTSPMMVYLDEEEEE